MERLTESQINSIKQRLYAHSVNCAERWFPIYKILNWAWSEDGVPNETEIREHIDGLIDLIKYQPEDFYGNNENQQISSGGITAGYDIDVDGDIKLILKLSDGVESYISPDEIKRL